VRDDTAMMCGRKCWLATDDGTKGETEKCGRVVRLLLLVLLLCCCWAEGWVAYLPGWRCVFYRGLDQPDWSKIAVKEWKVAGREKTYSSTEHQQIPGPPSKIP